MKFSEMSDVVSHLEYKNWFIEVYQLLTRDEPREIYLQVWFYDREKSRQNGRKWRLSENMTKSELVQTALKAVLTAEEHEAREAFKYRGVAVYSPHLDVDGLVALAGSGKFDLRSTGT